MLAFDKYGIDMNDLYQNAQDCQDHFGFNGQAAPYVLSPPMNSNYPQCFFGSALPIFDIDPFWRVGDLCGIANYGSIPSYLALETWCWRGVEGSCPPGQKQVGPRGECATPLPGAGPGPGKPGEHAIDCNMNTKMKGGGCTLSVNELTDLCNQMSNNVQPFSIPTGSARVAPGSWVKNITTVGYAESIIYIPKVNWANPNFKITNLKDLCLQAVSTCTGSGGTAGTVLGMVEISAGDNYQGAGQDSDLFLQLLHIGESCNPGGGYGIKY